MKLGTFTVELLSEGRFELFRDGHINRVSEDPEDAHKTPKNVPNQSTITGINPVLVKTHSFENILLDTGLGWGLDHGSEYEDVSNIKTNLEIFGVYPEDITHVILTHLHYDHAAGSSFGDAHARIKPTFPNATYFVHRKEWEYALSMVEQNKQITAKAAYRLDDFYRLVADQQVTFLEGSATQITKGVSVLHTGGHTPGHQVVHLQNYGDSAYYFGDLLPTSSHLNHYTMSEQDTNSLEAKKQKIRLLKRACQTKAILLFYHSKFGQYGRLIQDRDKQYILAEIAKP